MTLIATYADNAPEQIPLAQPQTGDQKANTPTSMVAHRAWSDAVEEAIMTADKISRQRPSELLELLIQFAAIWWWVVKTTAFLMVLLDAGYCGYCGYCGFGGFGGFGGRCPRIAAQRGEDPADL